MASLDFPSNPTDQQTYTLNGITYQYNAAIGAWLTVVVGSQPVTLAANTQVLYSNNGLISGSSGLVFNNSANTLYANTINVSSNMRVYGNLQVGTGTVTITNDSISAASITVAGSAIPSGNTSNAAFDKANSALQNTTGTFAGSLYTTGKLGIGTSSLAPNQSLRVYGGRSGFIANAETFAIGVSHSTAAGNDYCYIGSTSGPSPSLVFSNSGGSELMRMDNGGIVSLSGPMIISNNANQLGTSGSSAAAMWFSAAAGAIAFDDAAHKAITWNDGGGNFTMRCGSRANGIYSDNFVAPVGSSTTGASKIVLTADGGTGAFAIYTANLGNNGDAVGYVTNLMADPTSVSIEASNFKFNSGYGSSVVSYGVRAWVNFNGTGTVGVNATIRGSGNVTSVSKPATGWYRVNFTTAMPDANYTAVATGQPNGYSGAYPGTGTNAAGTQSTTYVPIEIRDTNNASGNSDWIQLLVVR